jgi:hypothetical protein
VVVGCCIVVVVDNSVVVDEGVPVVNGAPVDDTAPVVDGGTVVVGVDATLVNVVLLALGVPIGEDLLVGDGVPVGKDELVVVVVPIAAAAAAAAAAASAIDSVVAVVVDWGAVVVGYGVPVEAAVVEDDGVPDVDRRLVEEGVPVGNDVLVLVDVLDGAVVVMDVVIVAVVASTHAMIPIVTPRGLSEFCVDVIVIIKTVPFGT